MTEPAEVVELLDVGPASTWDRRVVSAFEVVYAARRGVTLLRVLAALVVLLTVVGNAMFLFDDSRGVRGFGENTFNRQNIGQFLGSIAVPLSFAGVVLAVSYLVEISAARLDVDIVVADDDQTSAHD